MVDYVGVLTYTAPTQFPFEQTDFAYPVEPTPDAWLSAPAIGSALAWTNEQPIAAKTKDVGGVSADSADTHFLYDRINIKPAFTDLGNLVSDLQQVVKVWNAYRYETKIVDDIVATGDTTGFTITPPQAPPYQMLPMVQEDSLVDISTVGPYDIDVTYSFMVDGIAYNTRFVGQRAQLWSFGHNWKTPVRESLEWYTDYIETYSGESRRAALRAIPRRAMEYTFLVEGEARQRLDNQLYGWQNRVWLVKLESGGCNLTQDVTAGDTVIYIDTTRRGFVVGQSAVIQNGDNAEVGRIASVASDSITLERAVLNDWDSIFSKVYPTATGYVKGNIPVTKRRINVTEGRVSFELTPVETDPMIESLPAPVEYQGIEVLLTQPDWKGGIQDNSTFDYAVEDFRTGITQVFQTRQHQTRDTTYRWLLCSIDEIAEFRAFLGRRKGRAKSFWLPSWTQDFTVVTDIAPAAVVLECVDNGFHSLIGVDPAANQLYIEMKDGSYFFREIALTEVDAGVMSITIDSPLGGPGYLTSDIFRISLMRRSTLSSDKVTMQWHNYSVMTVNLNIRSEPV